MFDDEFVERISGPPTIEADNSIAVRPGFSVTQTLAPRVGCHRLRRLHVQPAGGRLPERRRRAVEDRWKADSIVLSVGLVYSIF